MTDPRDKTEYIDALVIDYRNAENYEQEITKHAMLVLDHMTRRFGASYTPDDLIRVLSRLLALVHAQQNTIIAAEADIALLNTACLKHEAAHSLEVEAHTRELNAVNQELSDQIRQNAYTTKMLMEATDAAGRAAVEEYNAMQD